MTNMSARQIIQDGRSDFDFYIGTWHVKSRLLRGSNGSTSWEEFEGTSVCVSALGGMANVEQIHFDRGEKSFHGLTTRLFNPVSCQWSLYWSDSIHGTMSVPMMGAFTDGIGEFYSQETFESRAIFSRFIWSKITPTSCQWEQAYSHDGGKTWETNWIMEFTRQA
jgi:hypothetical protein